MAINSFCHSGTLGDLLYSLPIVKHFGGGDFYLHLNQIGFITQFYYGSAPNPFHAGRMNMSDFNFMKSFMESQSYITKFDVLDPKTTEITHNLDKFRPAFVGHPGNYVDIYAEVFGIRDAETKETLRKTNWLTVPEPKTVIGRDVAINRTTRWTPPNLSHFWNDWKIEHKLEDRAFFLGLEEEYEKFKKDIGWNIPHQKTNSLLEVAQYLDGVEIFIGNQSMALALAIGLGVGEIWCEARRDMEITRNECFFPKQPGVFYF